MNTALLIQQVYPNPSPYLDMFELTKERNIEYCKKHGFDYQHLVGVGDPQYGDFKQGSWTKVELINEALFKNYRYIVWLDIDCMIVDMETDLRDGCVDGIGVCWHRIPQGEHWNTGMLYVQNSQAAKDFMADWLSGFPGEFQWREQGVFNKLARKSRTVQTISDRWNATITQLTPGHSVSMVPDAVVLGFHGYGNAQQRYEFMKATLIETLKRGRGAGGTNGSLDNQSTQQDPKEEIRIAG
jgi:hypothetical protein